MKQITGIMQILDHKINAKSILIFDLDGTLVDTNYANFLSYKKAIQQVVNLDLDFSCCHKERFTRETLKKTIPVLSQIKYEKIILLKNKIYDRYLDKIELNISAIKILKKYSKTNKTILATNSHKERAIIILKYLELMNKFEFKFYKEDIDSEGEINKFEYVLNYLKLSPTSVIIFEDNQSEIDAAILLGIPVENIISI